MPPGRRELAAMAAAQDFAITCNEIEMSLPWLASACGENRRKQGCIGPGHPQRPSGPPKS